MGGLHLVTIGSRSRELIFALRRSKTADCWVFKMAAGCLKWLLAVLRDRFFAIQAAKMAAIWRIFAGQWVFTALERIERVSMHFNWVFYFTLRCFRLTAIFLEQIIVVKRGTTVIKNDSSQFHMLDCFSSSFPRTHQFLVPVSIFCLPVFFLRPWVWMMTEWVEAHALNLSSVVEDSSVANKITKPAFCGWNPVAQFYVHNGGMALSSLAANRLSLKAIQCDFWMHTTHTQCKKVVCMLQNPRKEVFDQCYCWCHQPHCSHGATQHDFSRFIPHTSCAVPGDPPRKGMVNLRILYLENPWKQLP